MTGLAAWLLEQVAEDDRDLREEARWTDNRLSQIERVLMVRRAIAEVDSKRKVLDEHRRRDEVHLIEGGASPEFADASCRGCGFDAEGKPRTTNVDECPTLRAVALAFVNRVGYREEWRP